MKEKIQLLIYSIKKDFPDLSEMEDSVQYSYIQVLEELLEDCRVMQKLIE